MLLAFVAVTGTAVAQATQGNSALDSTEFTCLDSSQVIVQTVDSALPTDSAALDSVLWNNYVTSPEGEKFKCLVMGWMMRTPSFAKMLIRKAAADSLDSESLEKCLRVVMAEQGENVYLPIRADFIRFGKTPAWAILVKWEYRYVSAREVLSHARVYVVDAATYKTLAFRTCD